MRNRKSQQTETTTLTSKTIQELSEDDLALICGGRSKEDEEALGEE